MLWCPFTYNPVFSCPVFGSFTVYSNRCTFFPSNSCSTGSIFSGSNNPSIFSPGWRFWNLLDFLLSSSFRLRFSFAFWFSSCVLPFRYLLTCFSISHLFFGKLACLLSTRQRKAILNHATRMLCRVVTKNIWLRLHVSYSLRNLLWTFGYRHTIIIWQPCEFLIDFIQFSVLICEPRFKSVWGIKGIVYEFYSRFFSGWCTMRCIIPKIKASCIKTLYIHWSTTQKNILITTHYSKNTN